MMMDVLSLLPGIAIGVAGASLLHRNRERERRGDAGLADKLNWRALVDERGEEGSGRQALIEMKDGALMAGWRYRGTDLDADTAEGLELLTRQVNFAFLPFVNNWMFHVDAIHREASGYAPEGAFPDAVTRAIDSERRAAYVQTGRNFETDHYLVATYLPPQDVYSRLGEFLVTRPKREDVDAAFALILDRFWSYLRELENRFPSAIKLDRLDADALLTHLHTCLTGKHHPVRVPDDASDLTRVLVEDELWGGFKPVLGGRPFRAVGITDFPLRSRPGLLADLNRLGLAYRFSSRFMPADAAEAARRIRWQTKGYARKTKPAMQQFREANGTVAPKDPRLDFFADQHAVRMAQDSSDAAALAASGVVRFCDYTPAIVVREDTDEQAELVAAEIVRVLNDKGLTTRVEDVNTLDAFAGTMPGHGYYNVRKPFVHTKNIAKLLPLTSKCYPFIRSWGSV